VAVLFPARGSESGRISARDSAGCHASIFFTACAILQCLLERVLSHSARYIDSFLCAPNLYSACWRCSNVPG
jgi:hypothetical protein